MSEPCMICPRKCGADRSKTAGFCGETDRIRIANISLHMWEEPPISGEHGSGTVFFSGCGLRCVYCQNRDIVLNRLGREITPEALADEMLRLEEKGAHNINLVTGTHFIRQLIPVLEKARIHGLSVPLLWNTSGYENVESLRMLDGLIDIYLPDFKYIRAETAKLYSHAPDYPETAKSALAEMVRQQPERVSDADGMMKKGVQVRHMVLPGHAQEAREILWYLHCTFGERIGISIMQQYTPMPQCAEDPLLSRRVTPHEYDTVVRYAEQIGIQNAYTQEREAASESFIPPFSGDAPENSVSDALS